MGKASILGYFPETAAWFKHHYLGDTFFDPGPAWEFPFLSHGAAQLPHV